MRRLALLGLLGTLSSACDPAEACEENVGAQSLDERVELVLADQTVSAELADDAVERERGWRKRACNREAILLVPDQPDALAVWGCELVDPIDVIGLRDGAVVFVERLDPCEAPCGGCPTVGEDVIVDGILEVLPNALRVEVGSPVDWT